MRVDTADDRGRVRLACIECDARVLIKVNPRTLKLSPAIPQTKEAPPEVPRVRLTAEQMAVWAVVVHEITENATNGARRALMTLPRFRSNPNKLHDVTSDLPFVIAGLKRTEAAFLEEQFEQLDAKFENGPQAWLLDERSQPVPPDVRGPVPMLDPSWTDDFEALEREASDVDISFDLSDGRNGSDSWPSFLAEPAEDDEAALTEIEDDELGPLSGDDEASALTGSPLSITNEVVVEDFDGFDFDESSEANLDFVVSASNNVMSALALPDTEERAVERSTTVSAMPVVTVERLPGMGVVYGGVHAQVAISSTHIGENPDEAIAAAMHEGERRLMEGASSLGAEGVVGLRTSQSAVPGPSGWLWILILSGTAVGP